MISNNAGLFVIASGGKALRSYKRTRAESARARQLQEQRRRQQLLREIEEGRTTLTDEHYRALGRWTDEVFGYGKRRRNA
jgi:hypothetical protein